MTRTTILAMNTNELRIAVAEADGWKLHDWGVTTPNGVDQFRGYNTSLSCIPAFDTDLNTIRVVFMRMAEAEQREVCEELLGITAGALDAFPTCIMRATAADWARAILIAKMP